MIINFPDNPVNGNQYTYKNITYTYKKSGSGEGYWAVLTPSSVGVATPDDINKGTDNVEYISPKGLDGSKYVREDESSGETVITANNLERIKATTQGVEITGSITRDNKPVLDDDVLQKDVVTNIPDGSVCKFFRIGRVVHFQLRSVSQIKMPTNGTVIVAIPAGFRPITGQDGNEYTSSIPNSNHTQMAKAVVNSGNLEAYNWDVADYLRINGSWFSID